MTSTSDPVPTAYIYRLFNISSEELPCILSGQLGNFQSFLLAIEPQQNQDKWKHKDQCGLHRDSRVRESVSVILLSANINNAETYIFAKRKYSYGMLNTLPDTYSVKIARDKYDRIVGHHSGIHPLCVCTVCNLEHVECALPICRPRNRDRVRDVTMPQIPLLEVSLSQAHMDQTGVC